MNDIKPSRWSCILLISISILRQAGIYLWPPVMEFGIDRPGIYELFRMVS